MEGIMKIEGVRSRSNTANVVQQKLDNIGGLSEIETRKIVAGYSQDPRVKANLYDRTWQVCENIIHTKKHALIQSSIPTINEQTVEKEVVSALEQGKIEIEAVPVMLKQAHSHSRELPTKISLVAVAGTVDRLTKVRNESTALIESGFESPADNYACLIDEISRYGMRAVKSYYGMVGHLEKETDPQEARRLYQALKSMPLADERLRQTFEKRISEILQGSLILGGYTAQRSFVTAEKQNDKVPVNRKKEADRYLQSLDSAIKHLRYCYSQDEIGPIPELAELTIKALVGARNKISEVVNNMASCHELATLFWPIRLGREYPKKAEFDDFISGRDFSKYQKRVADRRLRTDAAGFLFMTEKQIGQAHVLNPSQALVEYVDQLIALEKKFNPRDLVKNQGRMKFTVLVNDSMSIKFDIDTHREDCRQQIIAALREQANHRGISLSGDQRARLRLATYSVNKDKDPLYKDFYGYEKEKKVLFFKRKEKVLGGDYIINIQLPSDNRGNPHYKENDLLSEQSLFSVDHHKACLFVDLRTSKPGAEQPDRIAIKYNHRVFDGQPAKDHFIRMTKAMTSQDERTTRVSEVNIDLLAGVKPAEVSKKETYPLAEAFATAIVEGDYHKFTLEKDGQRVSISPTLTRSLTLALANQIKDFHFLTASDKNPFKDFGPVDNVQPIVVSLRPLAEALNQRVDVSQQKKILSEWLSYYDQAKSWARQGLSAPGVLSAPTGRAEKQLYFLTKIFHHGVKLLRESGGMFSPVPNLRFDANAVNLVFATAQSDVYGEPINLTSKKVAANMGVIGYSQETKETASYVVRKLPRHAQLAFCQFVEKQIFSGQESAIFKKIRVKLALKQMSKLVKAWDDLVVGDVDWKKYREIRQEVYESLMSKTVCGKTNMEKLGITSADRLQQALNLVLQQDADNTVNVQAIKMARQEIESLYRRCGFVEVV